MERGISHVLAGDVYDIEEPSELTLGRPIEAMRGFPTIAWHLMPSNHDSARSEGIWARLIDRGLPDNVVLHLEARPAVLGPRGIPAAEPIAAAPVTWRPDAVDRRRVDTGRASAHRHGAWAGRRVQRRR
jgi:hypothetical protein